MVKFVMNTNGPRRIMGIGLSAGNIERLKDGNPIFFSADELGWPETSVYIVFGETESQIQADLTANAQEHDIEVSGP